MLGEVKMPGGGCLSSESFWALMATPEIPKRVHPEAFKATWCLGELVGMDEGASFGAEAPACADGSGKWPRRRVTATRSVGLGMC